MRKIGIYGGTFDPVHQAHLILARDALEQLGLEQVIFVPAAASPHKPAGNEASAEARLAMLQVALADEPRFQIEEIELQRPAPSYTIETVVEMQRRYPEAQLFCLIGQDNVAALHTWRRFDELRELVRFVVLDRVGTAVDHAYLKVRRYIQISATEVRRRVAHNLPITYFVPPAVEQFIRERGLYREPEQ